jgi:hypothetical protein
MPNLYTESNKPAPPLGVSSSEGLGLAPERAVFDRWLRDNGHCEDQHDDMLMPLQRSLNELMWSAWKGATVAECERICAAIKAEDDHCADRDYMLDSDDCIAVARGQWKRPE